jgi:ParB family chromosome partitioning protein
VSRVRGAVKPLRLVESDPDALARALRLGDDLTQLVEAKLVPLDRIRPNPAQPRRSLDPDALAELADSIRRRGVLQPIRLRRLPEAGRYQIVAGERRWRAAELARLSEIPAIVVEQDDAFALVDALIENVQREDLNPLDRADALRRLRTALGATSWEAVGEAIGVSRATVHRLLGLQELPPAIQEDLRAGDLGLKHGEALRQLGRRPELQEATYRRIVDEGLSGDDALRLARELRRAVAVRVAASANGASPGPTRPDEPGAVAGPPGGAAGAAREASAMASDVATVAPELRRLARRAFDLAGGALLDGDRRDLLAAVDEARRLLDAARSRLAP